MNNKKRLTLIFVAMSSFVTASDTSSVGYMQQLSDIFYSIYEGCNKENAQHIGTYIQKQAENHSDIIKYAVIFSTYYLICVQVENMLKEHNSRLVSNNRMTSGENSGIITSIPKSAASNAIEEIVIDVMNENNIVTRGDSGGYVYINTIKTKVYELFDYSNQSVQRQQEIDSALHKFLG